MGRPKKEKPNRSGGLYEVKVTIGHNFDGSPIRKSFYSKISKETAKAKAEQYKIEQAVHEITGEAMPSNDTPFDSWAKRFLQSVKGTVKDSTYDLHYRNVIENHLIPYFGKRKIAAIKQIDVQSYFTAKQADFSLETLKMHRVALHKIFESAIQNDIIIKNPCDSIRLKSQKESAKKQTYTEEQCELVMAYAKQHRFGTEISIMLSCGISRSELLGLQWSDIDFESCLIYINRGVAEVRNVETGKLELLVGETKNEFRKRSIPVEPEIIDAIAQLERTSDYIFCGKSGNPMFPRTWKRRHFDVFMRDMHEYYEARNIDVPKRNPHELRHTRASIWVNSGANLFAVADVLGHADLQMLRKRYAHSDPESTRKMLGIQKRDSEK